MNDCSDYYVDGDPRVQSGQIPKAGERCRCQGNVRTYLMRMLRVSQIALAGISILWPVASLSAQVTLQPEGLMAGDEYRIVFVSSQRIDGQSVEPSTYDGFVQTLADEAPVVGGWNLDWRAMVGTVDTSIREHTETDPQITQGVPIYRIDGELFAPNYDILWLETNNRPQPPFLASDLIPLNVNELGQQVTELAEREREIHAWTVLLEDDQTNRTGVVDAIPDLSFNLGSRRKIFESHVYAISDVIVAVPEPGSHATISVLMFAVLGLFRRFVPHKRYAV